MPLYRTYELLCSESANQVSATTFQSLLIDSPFLEMVFPRRPTVICVEENEGREFLSFILPLSVLLLLGTVFIMYILYKTLVVCVYICINVCGWMSVYCMPDQHAYMSMYLCMGLCKIWHLVNCMCV